MSKAKPEHKLVDLFAKTANSVEFDPRRTAKALHDNTPHVQKQFIKVAMDLLLDAKKSEQMGVDCSEIEDMLTIADSLGIDILAREELEYKTL